MGKGKRDSALNEPGKHYTTPTHHSTLLLDTSPSFSFHSLFHIPFTQSCLLSHRIISIRCQIVSLSNLFQHFEYSLIEHVPRSSLTVGTEGRRSGPPSAHHVTLSRRSSMSIGLQGPSYNVDTTQIGVPVVTPRKERPGHKRSLTGVSSLSSSLPHHRVETDIRLILPRQSWC